MRVIKFGGTSVSGIESQFNILKILQQEENQVIVVLSAFSQVTNRLEAITNMDRKKDQKLITDALNEIKATHLKMILQLDFRNTSIQDRLIQEITLHFERMETIYLDLGDNNYLLAQGEYLSTRILNQWFVDNGLDSALYDSRDFISITKDLEPDMTAIKGCFENIQFENKVNVFQGYVCNDFQGNISNLQRGGSDYTATLIGAAIKAEEVQIWTDIDGFHNNDPRFVDTTFPIRFLSFNEAAELAYFGAKILHPNCLQPVRKYNIPVLLKNTLAIENQGTLISEKTSERVVTAIAAKDTIHAIRIESARMLNAHGFLYQIFAVFDKFKKSIDTVTTSEVSVSLTIDNDENIFEILAELKQFGLVEYESNLSIVCVVGDFITERKGVVAQIMDALTDVPLRMISYGGSENNITFLMDTNYKQLALQSLNDYLFENSENHARI
ncbi:MAG: aspartate kinase [Crocinitomicaceae bacterium]|nr:aspartate kinase [Crocinitomicaceae bacterium]